MLIEISLLPAVVQAQILAVTQGEVVEFAKDGKVIATLQEKHQDSLMASAGIFKSYDVDGLVYERQTRSEWD